MYISADPKEYDDTTSCGAVATTCKFPFKVNEKTYTSCTDDIVVEDDDVIIIDKDGTKKQTFQWCATSVNENQFMKKGKWGICDLKPKNEPKPSSKIHYKESFKIFLDFQALLALIV